MGSVGIKEKFERAPPTYLNNRIAAFCLMYRGFKSYFVCTMGSTAIKIFESHVFRICFSS